MSTSDQKLRAFINEKMSGRAPLEQPPADDRGGDGFTGGKPLGWTPPAPEEPPVAEPGLTLAEQRALDLRREPATELEAFIAERTAHLVTAPMLSLSDVLADEPEDAGPDVTVDDFIAATLEAEADLVAAGTTPAEHLAWAASCSPEEWAASCAESGWPIHTRPTRGQLPRSTGELIDRQAWAAHMERLKASGRRIL